MHVLAQHMAYSLIHIPRRQSKMKKKDGVERTREILYKWCFLMLLSEKIVKDLYSRARGGPAFQYHGFRIKSGVREKIIFAVIGTKT